MPPWRELQSLSERSPLFAGLLDVHEASGQPSEPGATIGNIVVFDQVHGSVANITEYASHADAVANAKAGNEAQPATPAEDGQPAEPAQPALTPADSGRYVWTAGPLTYTLNGRPLSDDTSQAVVKCIDASYDLTAPTTGTPSLSTEASTDTTVSATASTPTPQLVCVEAKGYSVPEVRPASCTIEPPGRPGYLGLHLADLHWTSWGPMSATATGQNIGRHSGANGSPAVPVRIVVSGVGRNATTGGLMFTRVTEYSADTPQGYTVTEGAPQTSTSTSSEEAESQ